MARDKNQDDKDWEAIRERKQRERDDARERAHQAAAAEEAAQIARDDKEAADAIDMLLSLAQNMDEAELDAAIKKHGRKHGKLSDKDKTRIKRAKGKGGKGKKKSSGCAVIAFLLVAGLAAIAYGAYEGAAAIASALF